MCRIPSGALTLDRYSDNYKVRSGLGRDWTGPRNEARARRPRPGPPREPDVRLAVDRDEQRADQDRDDVRDLDHRVDRGTRGVLVRVADGVAGDRRGMCLGALAAVGAVLDRLLRVVPGAAARGHRDREEEARDDSADQQAAEHLG